MRTTGRLAAILAGLALVLGVAPGCGDKNKGAEVEEPEDELPAGPTFEQLQQQAREAAAAGDVDLADAKYRAAFKAKADFALLEEHVTFLIDAKAVAKAVDVSKAYYDGTPTDARGMHLYAHALIAAGDAATALEVCEELVAMDDGDAAAHHKKGKALIVANQLDPGILELRRAVELQPKSAEFLTDLGSALHKAGNLDEASLQLRTANRLDPDNARTLMLLGVVIAEQASMGAADLEEAQIFLTQATKKSKDARPWFELGLVQNRAGDDLGAERSLAKAVEIEPDNTLYQYAYGEMLRFNKKYEEAIEAYRRSTEIEPPHPKAAAKLGLTLAEAGKWGDAEVYLTDATKKDPKNAFVMFNLGYVYLQQGKWKLSEEAFEKFLELADREDGERGRAKECIKSAKRKKKKC